MNGALLVLGVAVLSCAALGVYTLHAIPRGAPWPRNAGAGAALGFALAAGPVVVARIVLGVAA